MQSVLGVLGLVEAALVAAMLIASLLVRRRFTQFGLPVPRAANMLVRFLLVLIVLGTVAVWIVLAVLLTSS